MNHKNFIHRSKLFAHGNIHIGDIYNYENNEVSIPLKLNTIPSINLQKYLDRKSIVSEITEKLKNSKSPLIINGIGGIGKTTICRFIVSEFRDDYNYVLWVTVVSGIPVAFTNDIELSKNLHLSLEDTKSIDFKFITILSRLKKLKNTAKKNLLIIDNVDQDLINRINSKLVYDLLQIDENWKVLITTRNKYPSFNSIQLGDFSKSNAKKLYQLYSKEKEEEHLIEDFVEIVGYHPLTIELLTKTINSSNLIDLSGLMELLEEKGIRFEGQNPIDMPSYEKVDELTTTFKCLSIAFDISRFEEDENIKNILSIFSISPVSGFQFDELLTYIPNISKFQIDKEINTLINNGWLTHFGNRLIMHPVIQEVMRIKLNVNLQTCKIYIDKVLQKLEISKTKRFNPLDTNKYISFAIAIFDNLYKDVSFITVDDLALSRIGLSIGEFFFEHSDYDKALKYELKALKISKKHFGEFNLGLINILNNVAETYTFLEKYDLSLEYHKKCLNIKLKMSPTDSESIATSYNNLGNLYYFIDLYEVAIDYYNKALVKWKEVKNNFHLSSTMTNLGNVYHYLSEHAHAISNHEQAIEINEKIMGKDHPDLGRSYFGIVPPLISIGKYDKAEYYLTKAKDIFERIYDPNHDLITDVNDWLIKLKKCKASKKN